jgi:hypothetical protein
MVRKILAKGLISQSFLSLNKRQFCGAETKRSCRRKMWSEEETRTRRHPRAIFLVALAELTTGM